MASLGPRGVENAFVNVIRPVLARFAPFLDPSGCPFGPVWAVGGGRTCGGFGITSATFDAALHADAPGTTPMVLLCCSVASLDVGVRGMGGNGSVRQTAPGAGFSDSVGGVKAHHAAG